MLLLFDLDSQPDTSRFKGHGGWTIKISSLQNQELNGSTLTTGQKKEICHISLAWVEIRILNCQEGCKIAIKLGLSGK